MEKQTPAFKRKLQKWGNRLAVVTAPIAVMGAAHAEVDVSTGVAILATGVAGIVAVGVAKMAPNATIAVWGFVKQAFNRT